MSGSSPKTESISKKAALLSASSFLLKIIALISGMIVVRALDPLAYGTYKQTFLTFNLMLPILSLGLPSGLYYFLPTEKERIRGRVSDSYAIYAMTATLYTLFIVFGGNVLIANSFNNPDLKRLIPMMIPYVFIQLMNQITLVVFNIMNQVKKYMIFNIICGFTLNIGLAAAIVLAPTALTAVLTTTIINGIQGLVAIYLTFKVTPKGSARPDLREMKRLAGFSIPLGLSGAIGTLNNQVDGLFISAMSSVEDFAAYSVGSHEMSLISVITAAINQASLPTMRQRAAAGDLAGCAELYKGNTRKFATIMVPLMSFFMIWAPEFISIIYGDQYPSAVNIFRVYLLFFLQRICITDPVFSSLGMRKFILTRTIANIILNCIYCYFLVLWWGPIGAAVATIASIATILVFATIPTMAKVLPLKRREVYPVGLVGGLLAVCAGGGWLLRHFVCARLLPAFIRWINIAGLITQIMGSAGINKVSQGGWVDKVLFVGFSGVLYFAYFTLVVLLLFRRQYRWMWNQLKRLLDSRLAGWRKNAPVRTPWASRALAYCPAGGAGLPRFAWERKYACGLLYAGLCRWNFPVPKPAKKAEGEDIRMKKLLYISFEKADQQASGVNKKIRGQITSFTESGIEVTKIAQTEAGLLISGGEGEREIPSEGGKYGGRLMLCRYARSLPEKYDAVYMRFQFFSPDVLAMLKSFKKKGTKIVVEIPTYPYEPELQAQGLRGLPKLWCDRLYRDSCAALIDTFAAPLYDGKIYGRPCISIKNGADFSTIEPRKPRENGDEVHLLAVAMMAPWHGYDRVIQGLAKYHGKKRVVFHLVGEGVCVPEYRRLCDELGLSDSVVFHGCLSGQELSDVYDSCDVTISTLAFHRISLSGECREGSLKFVEAFARGIPVVTAEKTGTDFTKFDFTIPEDDSPVDIAAIVSFYDRLREKYSPEEMAAAIRTIGEERYDIRATQRPVIDYILDS